MEIPPGDIDLLTLGEALIDMLSTEEVDTLGQAAAFERRQGGSPANLCVNLAKLGGRAAFVGKTGVGAFGSYIKDELTRAGVITDYLVMDPRVHTSLVFVSRSKSTPDFEAFRDADYRLEAGEIAAEALQRARIVHASIWPLSREPSRSAIEFAFQQARAAGKIITFDPNYSRKIWPNHEEAREVIARILSYTTIVKPSLDDARRLFEEELAPEAYIEKFHALGPQIVVLTLGKDGVLLSESGKLTLIPAQEIHVVDVTGAGDCFWAGFLAALLDGHPLETCARFAREVVGIKLTRVGPLPTALDRREIYARIAQ